MIFPPFVELDALQRKTRETLAWTPSSVTQSHIFLYTHGLIVCNPALAVLAEFPWLWLPVVSPTNAEISQTGWITGHTCYIFQSLNSKSLVPLLTFLSLCGENTIKNLRRMKCEDDRFTHFKNDNMVRLWWRHRQPPLNDTDGSQTEARCMMSLWWIKKKAARILVTLLKGF